ncbi:MAG: hypothetical protein RLZZ252_1806 [Bacteroidota bacterium]|jgi:hypothetical protein
MEVKKNLKHVIGLIIAGLLSMSLFGLDLVDSALKRGAPTDTVVVYDTVFEFSPQRMYPRSYIVTGGYLPQDGEIRYGTWRGTQGYELYNLRSSRINISRRFALDAASPLRYRFLRSNIDLGIGISAMDLKYEDNYWDYYRDEYINNIRHVFERGGRLVQTASCKTLGALVNLNVAMGNFKKPNSRLTFETNAGLYGFANISRDNRKNQSFSYVTYDRHWIWYDNGNRELVSETITTPRFGEFVVLANDVDLQYHLDFRLNCRVVDQLYANVGLGFNGLLVDGVFQVSHSWIGLQYQFGTKYE